MSNVEEIILSTTVDNVDNEQLMMVIDEFGKQPNPNKSSLVTHYKLHEKFYDLTKPICESILSLANEWVKEYTSRQDNYINRNPKYDMFEIQQMWGMIIPAGEGVGRHDHWPNTFAFTYYLDVDDPLYFDELDYHTNPRPNELYLWRGHLSHGVSTVKNVDRYGISGSVNYIMPEVAREVEFDNHDGSDFFAKQLLNENVIT